VSTAIALPVSTNHPDLIKPSEDTYSPNTPTGSELCRLGMLGAAARVEYCLSVWRHLKDKNEHKWRQSFRCMKESACKCCADATAYLEYHEWQHLKHWLKGWVTPFELWVPCEIGDLDLVSVDTLEIARGLARDARGVAISALRGLPADFVYARVIDYSRDFVVVRGVYVGPRMGEQFAQHIHAEIPGAKLTHGRIHAKNWESVLTRVLEPLKASDMHLAQLEALFFGMHRREAWGLLTERQQPECCAEGKQAAAAEISEHDEMHTELEIKAHQPTDIPVETQSLLTPLSTNLRRPPVCRHCGEPAIFEVYSTESVSDLVDWGKQRPIGSPPAA
jgi:hypothetical protein